MKYLKLCHVAPLPLLVFAISASAQTVSFSKDIVPVLSSKCVQCHAQASAANTRMGEFDMRTRESFLKGGTRGPVVVPGRSAESHLYQHLTGTSQPQMPFGSRLTDREIALFKAWIDGGAQWDATVALIRPSGAAEGRFSAAQKRYWFFQPVVKPAVPKTAASNPVDAFLQAKLAEKKIQPNAPTDKVTLLRRATFDLTGLPPTPEETQAFAADQSPDAFARVVDRLLASSHYGERWGREWLDVVRYADTNGFKADEIRPNIWRYRDYVIQAFNSDKPYDRFIREQIAGDELYPHNVEAHIATGYLRHYTDETNQPSMEERREELLMNITDNVGSAFMGLTYACARCHDHKFDPILQKDYYRLEAFFANVRASDDFVVLSGGELEAYREQQAEYEAKTKDIRAAMHAMVAKIANDEAEEYMHRFSEGTRNAIHTPAGKRSPIQQLWAFQGMPQITHPDADMARRLDPEQRKKFNELAAQLKQFDALRPHPPLAQTMIDNSATPPAVHVLAVGSWNAPKEEVQPGFLSILDPGDPKIAKPAGLETTGRRTVLANWLADPKNPLTARVMVNRIWQGHFGTGIVASSSDFGLMGERPANQPLLDYLASAFVENGWSIKKMHRMIMLSGAYQESSAAREDALAADPDNRLLWRYPRHRVEAEELRDAMLLTSGRLNGKMGGPGIRPLLPEGVSTSGYSSWVPDKSETEAARRSVYVYVKRVLTYPMFEAFDAPNSEESCPRRFSTVVPSQALTMMNDQYVLDWSRAFAGRVLNDGGLDENQQIERAYRLAYSRAPRAEERRAVSEFLTKQTALIAGRIANKEQVMLPEPMPAAADPARAAAFVDFCHSLMSSNEFLYIN